MNRKKRHKRIRGKIHGTAVKPRLCVFRSLKKIYVQAINDDQGQTLACASGKDPKKVGQEIAQKCLKQKINKVVFDRAGYKYHGKVKTLAQSAREKGLKF